MSRLFECLQRSSDESTDSDWWERFRHHQERFDDPFDVAAATAFERDRLAGVVAAGYTGALDRLVPNQRGVRRSLCVTEASGNGPKAIETRWDPDGEVLDGTKTIVTLGTEADRLLVLAVSGESDEGWKDFVLLDVDANLDGIVVEPFELTTFVPELAHARVSFDGVSVSPDAVLVDDAWANAVMPFRMVEDLFVLGAVTAWFARLCRQTEQVELGRQCIALLHSTRHLSHQKLRAPRTALLYAGLYDLARAVMERFEWERADADVARRWNRDRRVLDVASRARHARTVAAERHFGQA